MCDDKKRCEVSASSRAKESLRKSINFQAKRAGLSASEWKDQNPELVKKIIGTYEERVKKFEQILIEEGHFSGSSSTAHIFGTQGQMREDNSSLALDDYKGLSQEYLDKLNLTQDEKHALLCYSVSLFRPVNSYLFKEAKFQESFAEHSDPWKGSEGQWKTQFTDEDELFDYVQHLDSALSHRSEEKIVYRGVNVTPDNSIVRELNGGSNVTNDDKRKSMIHEQYISGTEITFDNYLSTSDAAGVAATWSNVANDVQSNVDSVGIIFEIKTSAGLPISSISGHADEREVLLPRGMHFKVANSYWNKSTEEECYKYNDIYARSAKNPNTLIVQLVEVDENGNDIDMTQKFSAPELSPRHKRESKSDDTPKRKWNWLLGTKKKGMKSNV